MNIQKIIDQIQLTVQKHYLGNGEYCRFFKQNENGTRKMGNNEYGCADAANILYTIGKPVRDIDERKKLIITLQNFQHLNGLFDEGTHHPIHCTAHCTAALELFDQLPRLPLTGLMQFKDIDYLCNYIGNLPWENAPWSAAHEGAGIFAAFVLTGNADCSWQKAYFNYIAENTDSKYGIGFKGAIDKKIKPISHHLNGWFHYLFNFVYAHKPIPYAPKVVDTCIDLYLNKIDLVKEFGKQVGFAEIDWVYTINRAARQEGYRLSEVKTLLRDFSEKYLEYLGNLDYENNDSWNDLHLLFGMTCAIAELQIALPGEIETDIPLKLVLDRRPFI